MILRVLRVATVAAALLCASLAPSVFVSEASAACPYQARVITYNPEGWSILTDAFATYVTTCADYYITLPPLESDKTQPRGGASPGTVRSKGANFHPLAEFHWATWSGSPHTWFGKGVEFRRRMTAAGYDSSREETWAINEIPGSVRDPGSTGQTVRTQVKDLVRGLYWGPNNVALGGGVFVVGLGQQTTFFDVYKPNLKNWLNDSSFWTTMNTYVRWWGQEAYTDCRFVCKNQTIVADRSRRVNDFVEHVAKLANADPAQASAARAFFNESYFPMMTAFWKSPDYGNTQLLGQDTMRKLVSLEVYAARAWAGPRQYPDGRIGFAWDNSPAGETPEAAAAVANRLAAAIKGAYGDGGTAAKACSPTGAYTNCTPFIDGAEWNDAWRTFETW
jgi:hypothetical protein